MNLEADTIFDVLLNIIEIEIKLLRKRKRQWVRKWINRRHQYGVGNTLLRELLCEDPESYFNFLRIDHNMFQWLLNKVSNRIQKQNTLFRNAIPAELKLHIALRMITTGDSLTSLQYLFQVLKCTISKFLQETFDAIYAACEEFIKVLYTEEKWKEIINGFHYKWNFPKCIGAIDGKHIVVQCPPLSGSTYHNYKGTFSIVLLALVDDNYNFTCIDVGAYGSFSDGGIFSKSQLKEAIENNKLNIPSGSVIVGDEAFPLKAYLMKPFPRRSNLSERYTYGSKKCTKVGASCMCYS